MTYPEENVLRLIIMVVVLGSYFLGRFHSDWAYTMFELDQQSDPDRIFGMLVTMGAGALGLICLFVVAALIAAAVQKKN